MDQPELSPPPPPETSALGKGGSPLLFGIVVGVGLIVFGVAAWGFYSLIQFMETAPQKLAELEATLEKSKERVALPPPVEPPPAPPEVPSLPGDVPAPPSAPRTAPEANTTPKAVPLAELMPMEQTENVTGSSKPDVIKYVYDATSRGNIDVIRQALDMGYSPDQGGSYDLNKFPKTQTMLCMSIQNYHYDIALLLLERGANPNLPCSYRLPIYKVLETGTFDVAKALVKAGAKINIRDNHGATLLSHFVNEPSKVDFLLKHGADANLPSGDRYPRTVLEQAVRTNNIESVKLLLAAGADPNLAPGNTSARSVAERYKRAEILKLFK